MVKSSFACVRFCNIVLAYQNFLPRIFQKNTCCSTCCCYYIQGSVQSSFITLCLECKTFLSEAIHHLSMWLVPSKGGQISAYKITNRAVMQNSFHKEEGDNKSHSVGICLLCFFPWKLEHHSYIHSTLAWKSCTHFSCIYKYASAFVCQLKKSCLPNFRGEWSIARAFCDICYVLKSQLDAKEK